MIIELDPKVENIINEHAKAQGISAEQLVTNAINRQFRKERPFNFEIDEIDRAIKSG